MVEPVVRRARPTDVTELRRLEERARAGLDGLRGGAALLRERPAVANSWGDVVNCPEWWVAVGTVDEVIVGYIAMRLPQSGGAAVVTQVWVEPDARELGFGAELVQQAIDVARTHGATTFEAVTLPGDRATKNLYERAGVTARLITVSKVL